MSNLDNIAAYFNEKERKKLSNAQKESKSGLPEMTPGEIRLSCMENDGYETPELNDKLYLHFRGFKKIENLDMYTGCKAIWLDSNGFDTIEGLDSMTELRCLYLSKNLISQISGLSNLQFLTTLDLSNNRLTVIENLSCCPALQSLNVSKNAIAELDNIQHLTECPVLQTIDLMDNQLDGDILPTLERIPSLLSIALNGNPTTRQPSFRKKIIAALPNLCYLDRPVEEQERLGAVAFIKGGAEAEREARDAWREAQRQQRTSEMESFRSWQKEQRELREAQIAAGTYVGIKEFTEEEKAQREKEAADAANDEKIMLEGGVSNLAKKYWAIEGKRGEGGYNFDALNEAVVQMKREKEDGISNDNGSDSDGSKEGQEDNSPEELVIEQADNDDTSGGDSSPGATSASNDSPPKLADPVADIAAKIEDFEIMPNVNEDGDDITSYKKVEIDEAAEDFDPEFTGMSEEQAQNVRDQRVNDSLRIYMRQREIEKAKKNGTYVPQEADHADDSSAEAGGSNNTHSSTWAAPKAVTTTPQIAEADRPLYWSETMDLHLANMVRRHVFDFDEVAAEFQAVAETGSLGLTLSKCSGKLTADNCRLRWTQLDARQWAEVDSNSGAGVPVYKVHVQVDVLGKGHGAQPSFQSMASMAAGAMPSYLTPPTQFPAVSDAASDDEEDGSKEVLDGLD